MWFARFRHKLKLDAVKINKIEYDNAHHAQTSFYEENRDKRKTAINLCAMK